MKEPKWRTDWKGEDASMTNQKPIDRATETLTNEHPQDRAPETHTIEVAEIQEMIFRARSIPSCQYEGPYKR